MPRICIQVRSRIRVGLFVLAVLPLGCTHYDPVANSTVVGSGLGAATGAIVGSGSGNAGAGALIGAAAGAIGGALVGDAEQARAQRDSAYAYAQNVNRSQQYAGAVTNADVMSMAQNGLSDDVIINSINTRGGRFDTSPNALIQLNSLGVSAPVIAAMQNSGPPIAPVNYVGPPPAFVPGPPNVVVVEPRPRPIIVAPFGGPRYHYRRPRSGVFIQGRF